jgi:hypothetical protein
LRDVRAATVFNADAHGVLPYFAENSTFARLGPDSGIIHVLLDRTPIGGFNGYVYLLPIGIEPPLPEPEPHRPGEQTGEGEE